MKHTSVSVLAAFIAFVIASGTAHAALNESEKTYVAGEIQSGNKHRSQSGDSGLLPRNGNEGQYAIDHFHNGRQVHGGCISGPYLPGPGDVDGSGHVYPVPRRERCH